LAPAKIIILADLDTAKESVLMAAARAKQILFMVQAIVKRHVLMI
jgi:hypothetical protein